MSENPDYVMAEPEQSSNDVAMTIDDNQPALTNNESSSSNAGRKKKKRKKSKKKPSEPEQSPKDIAMTIDASGSQPTDDKKPALTKDESSSSNAGNNKKKPTKDTPITTIDAKGSNPIDESQPAPIKNKSSSSNAGKEKNDGKEEKERFKSRQELMEDIILKHAIYKPSVPKNATDEEKQADRRRCLNAKTTRWRKIFSTWPRDPKGKFITPDNSLPGKMAPNGSEIWGATLFDFYTVRRFPEFINLMTLSSGSKLAAWMKANGEYYAQSMIDFAENEADPELIVPYNITGLIQDQDQRVRSKKSWVRDDQDEDNGSVGKGKGKKREDWQVPRPWPPSSPFDPRAYPKPWPIEPFIEDFMGSTNYPKLQEYIVHSNLPKILKVHDPWKVLHAVHIRGPGWRMWDKEKKEEWSQKTDIVHTYKLKTSTKKSARRTKDDKLVEEDEAKRKAVYDKFIVDPHSRNTPPTGMMLHEDPAAGQRPGPTTPPIFVVFPFPPAIPPAREAHLYLSPNESIGEGNHSFVYNAEFELPRSFIMEDEICHQCIIEDMIRTLKEQDGPNGERRDPKWDEKVGRYVIKEVGKPPLTVSLDVSVDVPGEEEYLLEEGTLHHVLEYDGPYRLIHSKIGYQCLERGPYCEHLAKSHIHPLTAKVKVAAKISIEDDLHLRREAEMYQAFPRHFFEHWSGFNVVKRNKDPTPVGPLVPQFYGYYVPDEDPEQSNTDKSESGPPEPRQYLSPILLLEDCGKPLNPEKLTLDDQSEAAALVYRFHEAGWIHGSIAKRNILIQPGPLSDFPVARLTNTYKRGGHGVDWSFRLIDFGRSYELKDLPADRRNNAMVAEGSVIDNWIFHYSKLN